MYSIGGTRDQTFSRCVCVCVILTAAVALGSLTLSSSPTFFSRCIRGVPASTAHHHHVSFLSWVRDDSHSIRHFLTPSYLSSASSDTAGSHRTLLFNRNSRSRLSSLSSPPRPTPKCISLCLCISCIKETHPSLLCSSQPHPQG